MPNTKPIVCTLSPSDRAKRGPEWKTVLRQAGAQVANAPGGVMVTLQRRGPAFATLQKLIRAEQACCAWMNFEMRAAGRESTLSITSDSNAGAELIRLMMRIST